LNEKCEDLIGCLAVSTAPSGRASSSLHPRQRADTVKLVWCDVRETPWVTAMRGQITTAALVGGRLARAWRFYPVDQEYCDGTEPRRMGDSSHPEDPVTLRYADMISVPIRLVLQQLESTAADQEVAPDSQARP
jgi:hypothetical protein